MITNNPTGNKIALPTTINRIVSLVPSISELLYDLNCEDKIVGVTSLCLIPKYFQLEKEIIGSVQEISIKKIIDLKPDVVFASKDENSEEEIEELSKFVNVYITDVKDVSEAINMITNIGSFLNKRNDATKVVMKIDNQLEDLALITKDLQYRSAAYFIWNDPWVAAGKETFINSILKLIKVDNVFENLKERYPAVTAANIHIGNPDIIILPTEPHNFTDEDAIRIGQNTHDAATFFVDGRAFSWYGSRLIKSLDYLKLLAIKFKEMK